MKPLCYNRVVMLPPRAKQGRTVILDAQTNVIRFYEPNGHWGWLANFSKHQITVQNDRWQTVEHYFQAQKFAGTSFEQQIREAQSPGRAKSLAKVWHQHKRSDWEDVRISTMYEAVRFKFCQHQELLWLLIGTGSAIIVEDAADDDFWGQDRHGHGLNMMGKILMALRTELGIAHSIPLLRGTFSE